MNMYKSLFFNLEKMSKKFKNYGTNDLPLFRTYSPRLKNNNTLKYTETSIF